MTDITRRLGTLADMMDAGKPVSTGAGNELVREAIAEIGRLRANGIALTNSASKEIERLRAAVLAEREACASILDPPPSLPISPEAGIARHVRKHFAAAIRARTGKTTEAET